MQITRQVGGGELKMLAEEFQDLVMVHLCDWLEQVQRESLKADERHGCVPNPRRTPQQHAIGESAGIHKSICGGFLQSNAYFGIGTISWENLATE